MPFGFGIHFLARIKPKNMPWLALALGVGFELSQLILSLAFRSGFRAVDINDAIFNAAGALLGYAVFWVFGRVYARVYDRARAHRMFKEKGLFADIYEVVAR